MKNLLLLTFLLISATTIFAQNNATIKGTVIDTLAKEKISNAVISLLYKKDSVLYNYTRSKSDGSFEINNLTQGSYLLLSTYPGYADYYDTISLQNNQVFDFGKIMLTTKAHLLQDVTVRQTIAAIRMKGDTLVFKVDSFKMKEGATVEDLLKKFPGIQVDKAGKITAQGSNVQKVLVDGEEFFGDDPTIATRNITANMVNEVQVFDKKSEQATFTGVDDGQVSRTINLKLKDNKKKGIFGKMELGGGPNDRWNNSIMANSFKDKRKISFFGIASSTGKLNLDWSEREKFGEGNNMEMSDDGGMYFYNNDDNGFNGEGIPKSWSAGLNYANKYKKDMQTLNGSYRYSKTNNEGENNTIAQSILPDTLFINTEKRQFFEVKDKHNLNGKYNWNIDSSFSIVLNINGSVGTNNIASNFSGEALNANNQLVNNSVRNNQTNGSSEQLKTTLLLKKKFKKIGRTLFINFDQSYSNNKSNGSLFAVNNFYSKQGTLGSTDTINQRKLNGNDSRVISAKISYTEKLSKTITAELLYAIGINNAENKVISFEKSKTGFFDSINTNFSNDYIFDITTNRGGTVFTYNKKKLNIYAGSEMSNAAFKQKDVLKDSAFTYNQFNIFPRAGVTYKFNANSRLNIRYNGNTKQPTINQIQPLANNINPLNIQTGNPNLQQEFTNNINLNFNSYQVLKNRGYYVSANLTTTADAIRTNETVDSTGKRTFNYINTDGNYAFSTYIGYNMSLPKDVWLNINYNYSHNKSATRVNGLANINTNTTHGINSYIGKSIEKKLDLNVQIGFNYNTSNSSIRPEVNNNFWSMEHSIDATYQLPYKLEVNTSIAANIRQKTALFSGNNNVYTLNAYLARKLMKNDKAQFRIAAFDILDQNRGFNRYIGNTVATENTFTVLSRYFMASFIWNFNKGGVTAK